MPCCGVGDLRFVLVDPAMGATTEELLVAITVELLGKAAGVGVKEFNGLNKALGDTGFDTIEPDVLGYTVNKENAISKAELADGVAVKDVKMNLVNEVWGGREDLAVFVFLEVHKLANRGA